MPFSSKLIEQSVNAFASLPGIGRKTALRLTLHLLKQDGSVTEQFANALSAMKAGVKSCRDCFNYSDHALCEICADARRDRSLICVVESVRDLMAIEETGQFRGLYHILGGIISPIEGIGPAELNIAPLVERCGRGEIKEVIMAISLTIEGETTIYYISRQLQNTDVRLSAIARGVSFGGDLEYADELTLGRSIVARTPYAVK